MTKHIPVYSYHKSGQARVRIHGETIYLGLYESPESQEKYRRIIAEYMATGELPLPDSCPITCADLAARFLIHAEQHYRKRDGRSTGTTKRFRRAMTILCDLYATLPVKDFGPAKLKAVRVEMISLGWARTTVNSRTSLVRQVFGWGVAEELVPAVVSHALEQVRALEAGRTEAHESPEIKPAIETDVWKARKKMNATVAAMVSVQLYTGMRTGEVCDLRPVDIRHDWPTKGIWTFQPADNKNAHHGIERTVLIGPKAQEILVPFLKRREPHEYVFQPCEAMPKKPKWRRCRSLNDRYRVDSYCRAVARACEAAGVTHWSPGQLRHNAATYLMSEFGPEVARIVLGHTTLATTRRYAEDDLIKAAKAIKKVG